MADSNSIDLKVISCKGLKCFNFFQKLSVYSRVSLGTGDCDKAQRQQSQKTPIDHVGGRNPEWNHEMRFDLVQIPSAQRDLLFLEFDILSESIFADKLLGEVRVPIADLVREANGAVRFVSYQIRSSDGKPNGILHFSYKVDLKEKIASYPTVDASPAVYSLTQGDTPIGYYPAPAPAPAPAPVPYCPPPAPVGFPTHPPDLYGYRPAGYGYASYGYKTVQYPPVEGARPYDGDAWRQRELGWNGSGGF